MRILARHVVVPLLAVLPGCVPHGPRYEYEEFARSGSAETSRRSGAAPDVVADVAGLEKEARLEAIVRIALARNPEVREGEARVRERLGRVSPSGRLPDLELKYEQWGVPLRRPHALNDADALMIGVRQTFPALGSLGGEARAAEEEARESLYGVRAQKLDVIKQVQRAYFEYVLADREVRIHLEHVELTDRILELTRSHFRSGGVTEQDVLRVGVELKGLHRDLARIGQRKRSAAALLNTLMGREGMAPIGPAPDLEATEIRLSRAELVELSDGRRPEILAAGHGVAGRQAEASAARSRAAWPSFMVGLDYMLMPTAEERHGYGAMVSINLPWLNPKNREEARAAELATEGDRRALDSVKNTVRYEVIDAFARYEAARATYLITRDDLLPAALQSFEAGQAGFASGRGSSALALLDALQSLLEIRLDQARELVELKGAVADLERAVGADLDESPVSKQGATR